MEYLETPLRLSDVRDILGSDWQSNAQVFVHESTHPLPEAGVSIRPPGMLIRVLPRGRSLKRNVSLGDKLERPDLFLRRLDTAGFPGDPHDCSGYCLVQPLAPPHVFGYSPPLRGPSAFDSVALSHASREFGPANLLWPTPPIRDMNVRERLTGTLCGAFPRRLVSYVPVFVDSRAVCSSLQIRASCTGVMPLAAFLDRIGLLLPHQLLLSVTGTAHFDEAFRCITIHGGETVCLQYRVCWPGDTTCIDLDPDSSSDRDRSPRRSESRPAVTASAVRPAIWSASSCAGGTFRTLPHTGKSPCASNSPPRQHGSPATAHVLDSLNGRTLLIVVPPPSASTSWSPSRNSCGETGVRLSPMCLKMASCLLLSSLLFVLRTMCI